MNTDEKKNEKFQLVRILLKARYNGFRLILIMKKRNVDTLYKISSKIIKPYTCALARFAAPSVLRTDRIFLNPKS